MNVGGNDERKKTPLDFLERSVLWQVTKGLDMHADSKADWLCYLQILDLRYNSPY